MQIDTDSTQPVYRQIVLAMQSAISAGIYRPGEEVPSTRSMAIDLKVNPNTVQKAYEELVRSGVLESRRGRGKIVANRGEQSALKQSENAIQTAFLNGIELARASGLSDRRIRELLSETLKMKPRKARA